MAGFRHPILSASSLGAVVTLAYGGPLVDAGPDVVSFSPPPFDVISDTAVQVPAPAFTDFPLL